MRTEAFDYDLPADRIAQTPAEPRDSARLLVVERRTGALGHHVFRDLPGLLGPGDLLVANDSRVIPARLRGRKVPSGGAVEVLLLRPADGLAWEALVRGRVVPGTRLAFGGRPGPHVEAEVVEVFADGRRLVRFDAAVEPLLGPLGEMPLPPYIRAPLAEPERYQTVYARVAGSAAAPTAGLHFTPGLIEAIQAAGIGFGFVTLHVGLDTFQPLETAAIEDHVIHREWAELPASTAEAVARARRAGGRVVAVGTTAVRVLETAARDGEVRAFAGWTDVYITPGHRFRAVDALVTNFHLPRSTLLVLVSAFAGKDLVDRAYAEAIEGGYRFYSFGDAMLVV